MKRQKTRTWLLCGAIAVLAMLTGITLKWFAPPTTAKADSDEELYFGLITDEQGNQSYDVSLADFDAEYIVVPDEYNGLPVTEICAFGFTGATKLQWISLPDSVVTIGEYAFYDCPLLKSVLIPDGVSIQRNGRSVSMSVAIGDSAFSECNALEDMIIPDNVSEMGAYAFDQVPETATLHVRAAEAPETWSADWLEGSAVQVEYNSDFQPEIQYEEINNGTAYRVKKNQNFADASYDIEIPLWHNDKPVQEIATGAFTGSTFNSVKIVNDDENNATHSIIIRTTAFGRAVGNIVDLGNYAEIPSNSIGIFNNAQVETVIIPDNIEVIPSSMFMNSKVQVVKTKSGKDNELPYGVKEISKDAFRQTFQISELYVPSSIETIGQNAFGQWKSEQYIHIDLPKMPESHDIAAYGGATVLFNEFPVSFEIFGHGNASNIRLDRRHVEVLPIPTHIKPGYIFKGWFESSTGENGSGEMFADKDGVQTIHDLSCVTEITLYAKWKTIDFTVIYDKNNMNASGTMSSSRINPNNIYLKSNAYSLRGSKFTGWSTEKDGRTGKIEDGANVISTWGEDCTSVTLYAQWEEREYTVIFDSGFGIKEETVKYSDSFRKTLLVPSHRNIYLEGYYLDDKFTQTAPEAINAFSDSVVNSDSQQIKIYAKIAAYDCNTVLTIPDDCTRLYVSSRDGNGTNFSLTTKSRRSDTFDLTLDDLTVKSTNGSSVLNFSDMYVNVRVLGTVSLEAGETSDGEGVTAAIANSFIFDLEDSAKLFIYGGFGSKGQGGDAIRVSRILRINRVRAVGDTLTAAGESSLKLIGGSGGTTNVRSHSTKGGNAVSIETGYLSLNLQNTRFTIQGGDGGRGILKVLGSDGGSGIVCGSKYVMDLFFSRECYGEIRGGNGGTHGVTASETTATAGGYGIETQGAIKIFGEGTLAVYGGDAGKGSLYSHVGGVGIKTEHLSVDYKMSVEIHGGRGSNGTAQLSCGVGGAPAKLTGSNRVDVTLGGSASIAYVCGAGGTNTSGGAGGAEQRYTEAERIHLGKGLANVYWTGSNSGADPYQ